METKKKSKIIGLSVIGGVFLLCAIIAFSLVMNMGGAAADIGGDYVHKDTGTTYYGSITELAENYTDRFVMTRMKSLGGSHYAYTEGVSDEFPDIKDDNDGAESNYFPGSQLVLLTIGGDSGSIETVLIDSPNGVVRDPDVSPDGTKIVFSYKASKYDDDFHLYVLDLEQYDEGGYDKNNIWDCITQLTFGQGVADIEPQWLANGKILFSSSRAIQRVDCWHTVVSNLFTCNADGSNIIRLGYDQVHTTYPTTTADGRVLYTRWDYNDRNQMYVQGVFQMNADGTNQTELYGNNTNNVTTLLHTREMPGNSDLYISIASGHHVSQGGKLCIVDLSKGENGKQSIEYVFEKPDRVNDEDIDTFAQNGPIYKYPYAINDKEFFVAKAAAGWQGGVEERANNTDFDILYCVINDDGTITQTTVAASKKGLPCGQIVPIVSRDLFNRSSMVNYGTDKGTYYVADVYEGPAMEGVERGAAKYLRVVELEYRSYANGANASAGTGTADPFSPVSTANGAWDIKKVLGIVDIEEDGSAMFQVPSDTPVYFQILDENGFMIQSMRSWSTLMPNETYSCVGCHEPKSTAPPLSGGITDAMKKGVQLLKKDLWMDDENYENYNPYKDSFGFSYADQVQPMLDESCISCHSNNAKAIAATGATGVEGSLDTAGAKTAFDWKSSWQYLLNPASEPAGWNTVNFSGSWAQANAGFGDSGDHANNSLTSPGSMTQSWNKILLRKTFAGNADMKGKTFYMDWQFDEDPVVYINGMQVGKGSGYTTNKSQIILNVPENLINYDGNNVIAVSLINTAGGTYFDGALKYVAGSQDASKAISFRGDESAAMREKLKFPISYLVLTNSKNIGNQYRGDSTLGTANGNEGYTTWISAMSQCEILPPYTYGSTNSKLIEVLKNISEHTNGAVSEISFEDMARYAAWIDLGVPFRGRYEEGSLNVWGDNEWRDAMEGENMREFYNTQDKMNKRAVAGLADKREVSVQYDGVNGSYSLDGSGYMQLFVDGGYKVGDTVTVILPKDTQYFYFNLNHRMKTSLIYAPEGVYTYRIPEDMQKAYPKAFTRYATAQITVFLPTEEELKQEYNLALNPYAMGAFDKDGVRAEETPSFPRVTASSYWGDGVTITGEKRSEPDDLFNPECAVDGFYANPNSHGTYPTQSWGADKDDTLLTYTVEFGRDVTVNGVSFRLRADWAGNHDTYFDGVTITLADGTEAEIQLIKDRDWQTFSIKEFAGIKTDSITFKFSKAAGADWAGISELNVFGCNV